MPRKEVNYNRVSNANFESYPAFTAATTTTFRWIDGSAGGSLTTDTYKWAFIKGGTSSAQFDTSVYHGGSASMKLSTLATGSYVEVRQLMTESIAGGAERYMIPVLPSTSYTGTYWMKTNLVSGTATNGAAVAFVMYNGVLTAQQDNNGTYIKTTTDWTQYTVTFTTNSVTRFVMARPTIYGHQGTGTLIMDAWFDDIVFKPTTPVTRTAVS